MAGSPVCYNNNRAKYDTSMKLGSCWGDEICFFRRKLCVPLCSRLQLMRSSVLGLKLSRAHKL